jgi:hypothetical protein
MVVKRVRPNPSLCVGASTEVPADDLLGCDCQDVSPEQLKERKSNVPSPDGSDDSDDEEKLRGFVSASQYDPEPVSGLLRRCVGAVC